MGFRIPDYIDREQLKNTIINAPFLGLMVMSLGGLIYHFYLSFLFQVELDSILSVIIGFVIIYTAIFVLGGVPAYFCMIAIVVPVIFLIEQFQFSNGYIRFMVYSVAGLMAGLIFFSFAHFLNMYEVLELFFLSATFAIPIIMILSAFMMRKTSADDIDGNLYDL